MIKLIDFFENTNPLMFVLSSCALLIIIALTIRWAYEIITGK